MKSLFSVILAISLLPVFAQADLLKNLITQKIDSCMGKPVIVMLNADGYVLTAYNPAMKVEKKSSREFLVSGLNDASVRKSLRSIIYVNSQLVEAIDCDEMVGFAGKP